MAEPLQILYQDEWLIAVDKPAGHLVHPADEPQPDDLVTMKILRDQIGQQVYNIHRIDRPTTGVLLFGIDRDASRAMHRAFEAKTVSKRYLAIVPGKPDSDAWECHEPIQKNDNSPARNAHTSFTYRQSNEFSKLHEEKSTILSLLECVPHTGRFHQIRRHLLHANMPIVGDFRYAGIEASTRLGELLNTGTRMLLQSYQLTFNHPITSESITITAPADEHFARLFPSTNQVN